MKQVQKVLRKIFKKLNLGKIKEVIEDSTSMYKVTTEDKSYIVKHYNKNDIKNNEDLLNKQRQIAISTKLSENGVPTITPLSFDSKYLIKYQKDYFLVYDSYTSKPISYGELSKKSIKKIANTLAIIHKLNITTNLPYLYKKTTIDLIKYSDQINNEELRVLINDNNTKLQKYINNCNNSIDLIKEELCISINNYNLENILWENDYIYLVNFDEVTLSNPIVSLIEISFNLSNNDNEFNLDFYKEFLTTYLKKYGDINLDFDIALNTSMNIKLQELEVMLTNNKAAAAIKLIKEILLFIDNKDNMLNCFNDYNKELIEKKNKKKKKKKKSDIIQSYNNIIES